MITRDMIQAVKEMLERHWDVYTMAQRLRMDPYVVQQIVDFINNTLT